MMLISSITTLSSVTGDSMGFGRVTFTVSVTLLVTVLTPLALVTVTDLVEKDIDLERVDTERLVDDLTYLFDRLVHVGLTLCFPPQKLNAPAVLTGRVVANEVIGLELTTTFAGVFER